VGEIIDDRMESDNIPNNTTIKAIKEANEGKTVKCDDFDDYLKKVK
jgi:antitoxin component of RelBE/YafQ-DinJ toxin-antitoxin module